MRRISSLFSDLEYLRGQFKQLGEALVELSRMSQRTPEYGRLSRGICSTYSLFARDIVRVSREIRKRILPKGVYLKNPYELDLKKMESYYRILRGITEAAAHKVSRCKNRTQRATALSGFRALEKDLRDAAKSLLMVAQYLGKDTPEWREHLKIEDWL